MERVAELGMERSWKLGEEKWVQRAAVPWGKARPKECRRQLQGLAPRGPVRGARDVTWLVNSSVHNEQGGRNENPLPGAEGWNEHGVSEVLALFPLPFSRRR